MAPSNYFYAELSGLKCSYKALFQQYNLIKDKPIDLIITHNPLSQSDPQIPIIVDEPGDLITTPNPIIESVPEFHVIVNEPGN